MSKFIKYDIRYIPPKSAEGPLAAIYEQINADLMGGTAPAPEPFTVQSPALDVLAGLWATLRESLLAGHVDHGLKQGVATAVSQANDCPWCVDAHSIVMNAAGYGQAAKALTQDVTMELEPYTEAVLAWAKATYQPTAAVIQQPPIHFEDVPEIVGTAVTFHYLNRIVNITLTETALPTQPWLKSFFKRAGSLVYRRAVRDTPPPGASLAFLPPGELAADLAWAAPDKAIAGAFARFTAVIDAIEGGLPTEVVALLKSRLQTWVGQSPGLSRGWLTEAVVGLPDEQQPAARLALLAAFASYQVDSGLVAAYRDQGHDDQALIELLAWASFSAARRVGAWLAEPFLEQEGAA